MVCSLVVVSTSASSDDGTDDNKRTQAQANSFSSKAVFEGERVIPASPDIPGFYDDSTHPHSESIGKMCSGQLEQATEATAVGVVRESSDSRLGNIENQEQCIASTSIASSASNSMSSNTTTTTAAANSSGGILSMFSWYGSKPSPASSSQDRAVTNQASHSAGGLVAPSERLRYQSGSIFSSSTQYAYGANEGAARAAFPTGVVQLVEQVLS